MARSAGERYAARMGAARRGVPRRTRVPRPDRGGSVSELHPELPRGHDVVAVQRNVLQTLHRLLQRHRAARVGYTIAALAVMITAPVSGLAILM